MAEVQVDDSAFRLLRDGEAMLQDNMVDEAIAAFKGAQSLFEAAGDEIGVLESFTKLLATLINRGDAEEALNLATERKMKYQAKWNITGEICMLEQIINAHFALEDFDSAEKSARKALEHFREYDASGVDTTAGSAFMWYSIAQAHLQRKELDDAMNAAENATKLFSDAGDYEHESLSVKLYNEAVDRKGKTTYLEAEKQNFYKGIRIGGIQYGPRYQDNHVIMVRTEGTPHVACCLQLTCPEGEAWEHEVGFHPGLIDAGGHSSFANAVRPDVLAQAAENAKDPNYVQPGPSIPFLMDHGELRHRKNNSDIYINNAGSDCYMFSSN